MAIAAAVVVAVSLVGLAPFQVLAAASGGYSSVQLSVQVSGSSSVNSYSVTAYNSSGWPVATYQGMYSQVTFLLPPGTYLFAANALGAYPKEPCVYSQSMPPQGGPGVATGAESGAAIMPPCVDNREMEYGYSLTQVSGPATIIISTQVPGNLPTSDVTVRVDYKNGTAVSGAYVSAGVVGGYYWGSNPKVSMYAQTGKDGIARMVVPAAPLTITAWKSVEVNIPKSQSTVQVNIGGQPVNVTLYYAPMYVTLRASALLVPPHSSITMSMAVQSGYQTIPYANGTPGLAGSTGGPDVGTRAPTYQYPPGSADQNASSPSTQAAPIPPLPGANVVPEKDQATRLSMASSDGLLAAGAIGVVGLITAFGLASSRAKR